VKKYITELNKRPGGPGWAGRAIGKKCLNNTFNKYLRFVFIPPMLFISFRF
jgi:hypothetical protein